MIYNVVLVFPVQQIDLVIQTFFFIFFFSMVYRRILNIVSCATQWTSLIAQLVKSLSAMQETWVRFLGQEGPLEKDLATHSSIPA